MIISIEGIDGAGKNTLVRELVARIGDKQGIVSQGQSDQEALWCGNSVTVLAFPRYAQSIHAQLAAAALRGKMGDLVDSAYGMATMFALDRHGALPQLQPFVDSSEVLLLDRYVASNAAYTAARLDDDTAFEWVSQLEFSRLGLPRPTLQVLLDTPVEVAVARTQSREAADTERGRDAYEKDSDLQARTLAAYHRLAATDWESPWVAGEQPEKLSEQILAVISSYL